MKIKYTMFSLLLLASIMHNLCAMESGDKKSDDSLSQASSKSIEVEPEQKTAQEKYMSFTKFNPLGTRIAFGGKSGVINIQEKKGEHWINQEYKMEASVLSACWDSTGDCLIANLEGMALEVIDAKNKCIEDGKSVSEVNVTAICFSPDDEYCMTVVENDSNLCLAQGGEGKTKLPLEPGDCINEICCSKDNKFFACSDKGTIYVYDTQNKNYISFKIGARIYSIDVDPSGKYLAFGDAKGCIKILDVANQRIVYKYNIQSNVIASVRWSKTGEHIAVVSHNGKRDLIIIWKWSGEKLECANIIYTNGQSIASKIDWSPDNTSLLIGYENETINMYDISQATREKTVEDEVFSVFSATQYMTREQKKDKLLSILASTLPLSLKEFIQQQLSVKTLAFNSI